MGVAAVGWGALGAGCNNATTSTPATAEPVMTALSTSTPTSTPTAPASTPAVEGDPWVGAWQSGPCGARKYPRWITIDAGGVLRGQERISPCPPNVACVWSGIIPWQGAWKKADGGIAITVTSELTNDKMMKPLPERLTWDAAASVLVEAGSDPPCRYERRSE